MRRSERDVEQLVRENEKLVHFEVNRYLQRFFVGDMEREDLISWGMIGLVQAARAWDPERAASFSTLACRAIQRMIIRGVRREWKPERAAATVSLDELLFGEEQAGSPERFVDRLAADQDVENELVHGEAQAAVRSAVAQLPAPDRQFIERRYYEEVPVTTLAQEWGQERSDARGARASTCGSGGPCASFATLSPPQSPARSLQRGFSSRRPRPDRVEVSLLVNYGRWGNDPGDRRDGRQRQCGDGASGSAESARAGDGPQPGQGGGARHAARRRGGDR
jgi:RNA polymerase sigma factor (sigma-70 family)